MLKVGIFGAASLTAGKLIELLLNHPEVEITHLTSEKTYTGKPLEESFQGRFKNLLDLKFVSYESSKNEILNTCDVMFLSKPHVAHGNIAAELLDNGIKVIDLSADFRLKDVKMFHEVYKPDEDKHPEYFKNTYIDLVSKAVYGLPEIHADEISKSNLVANPGCYPTSVILGLAPLVKEKLIKSDSIIVDSLSGVSGAGKSRPDKTQFIDINNNIIPYKIGTHQHKPEMEQELSFLSKEVTYVLFAPNIIAMDVGIVSTIYATYNKELGYQELLSKYETFYANKPFVRIYKDSDPEMIRLPHVKDVVNTNFCDIGISIDPHSKRYIIKSVIDNTIKGAAGQAIQNMNLMFGLDETIGLPFGQALKRKSEIHKAVTR